MALAEKKKNQEPDESGEDVAETDVPPAPLRLRLRAWWDGSSLQQVMAEEANRLSEPEAGPQDGDVKVATAVSESVEVEPEPDVP